MTRRCRFSGPDASLSEFSQVNVEVAKLCSRDLFLGFDQRETPDAEDLFPKAYEPVLLRLLDVISERLGPEVSEALLRAAGSSLAEGHIAPLDDTYARLEVAVNVFNELGVWRSSKSATGSW
jgi:hypothetical protein